MAIPKGCKLCESPNGKMTKYLTTGNGKNEFLNVELFDTMFEVEVLMK